MPSILNLKFKGNKSFVAFSNLNDTEALSQTWKVCTKVASYLEQGQRLENLSWRLWHLQNLMVDTDNAKSKREFKKLSKCMGDKLDKEKGRSIEELEAPDFRRTSSTELIRQRAAEKERYREQNSKPGTIKRMQFTFSVDQPHAPGANLPVKKPDLKPSPEFTKRTRAATRAHADDNSAQSAAKSSDAMAFVEDGANDKDSSNERSNSNFISSSSTSTASRSSLKFDSIFDQGFGPSALLFPAPTLTTSMNYGEGLNPSNAASDVFSISRPTIELPLDEILNHVDSPFMSTVEQRENDTQQSVPQSQNQSQSQPQMQTQTQTQTQSQPQQPTQTQTQQQQQDVVMKSVSSTIPHKRKTRKASTIPRGDSSEDEESSYIGPGLPPAMRMLKSSTVFGQSNKDNPPETVAPSKVSPLFNTTNNNRSHITSSTRPTLTVRTQTGSASRSSGPGATATSLNPAVLRSNTSGNNAPGGVKAECSNCGATHTPLWRRGLNDELNCNACGLYCKLHKRPRPKSMRNSHGEGRTQAVPRQDPVDVMIPSAQTAQCYNCHTTATPLWRKDDEGKTVCNACGLYYKLHGSARPISMKSDVIRKRSRHDARRGSNANSNSVEDTPSASPGASRRTSPAPEHSPTLAPDSSTQGMTTYEFTQEHIADAFGTQSELVGALGQDQTGSNLFQNTFQFQFPGPYHPDYLLQMYTAHAHAAASNTTGTNTSSPDNISGYQSPNGAVDSASPIGSGDSGVSDIDLPLLSPRSNKRRRLSTDSASDPPSSAVSYFSSDGYSSATSVTSLSSRSSMDFSFTYSPTNTNSQNGNCGNNGTGPSGPVLRGSGNTFWHPPMMPQTDEHSASPRLCYPSILPSASAGNANKTNGSASSSGSAESQGNMNVNAGGESTGNGTHGTASGNGCAANGVEDSPMDYLHHPMSLAGGLPDDDSLFSAYLHPPMALHEDSPGGNAIVV